MKIIITTNNNPKFKSKLTSSHLSQTCSAGPRLPVVDSHVSYSDILFQLMAPYYRVIAQWFDYTLGANYMEFESLLCMWLCMADNTLCARRFRDSLKI